MCIRDSQGPPADTSKFLLKTEAADYIVDRGTTVSDGINWEYTEYHLSLIHIYLRLSKEDGDEAESNIIRNQRILIEDYVKRQADIDVDKRQGLTI